MGGRVRARFTTIGLVALVATALLIGGAHAEGRPTPAARNAELRADVAAIAEQEGWSMSAAVRRVGWQEWFSAIADKLRSRFPDRFAGAAITGKGTGAWIAFADEVPALAGRMTAKLPVPVRLIGDRGFTEAELIDTLNARYAELTRRSDVRDAVGSYDLATGVIDLDVLPAAAVRSAREKASALARLAPRPAANRAIDIDLGLLERPDGHTDSDLYGGGVLFLPVEGRRCTAAFTVVNKFSGREGVSTAYHCATSTLRYYHHGARSYTTIERIARAAGTSGDIAWYTPGSYTPTNAFYYDYGKTRMVRGSGTPEVGQRVCNYGRATGYKCTTVYRNNVCREAGAYCGLTAASREVTYFGDSGGPWFFGTNAYGVHSARTSINGAVRSLFTPVNRLNDLGVKPIIAPCRLRLSGACLSY